MSPPSTFERVYVALKDKLRSGAFRPGERLEPAHLSEELHASVTPVRDALHRLTGERLVEAPPHEGFRVPACSEILLRHLYAWHQDLLLLALSRRPTLPPALLEKEGPASQPQDTIDELVASIASTGGNPELLHALRSVRARLEPFAPVERLLLSSIEAENQAILEASRSGDRRALRTALVRYHRRRNRLVPEILAVALSRSPAGYNRDTHAE